MEHELSLDRLEGEWVILDWGGTLLEWPRALLPPEAEEGWIFKLRLERDTAREAALRTSLELRVRALLEEDDEEDFDL